ncbi:MAG: four-helix bundle copper-binding protein [Myxococcota bacterium]
MTTYEHQQPVTGGTEQHQISTDMQRCIDACVNAHAVCVAAVEYCLKVGGKHANPEHIRMLLDTAEMCETAAHFMLRGSPLHTRTCGLTSEVAEECANSVESLDSGDPQLRAVADAIRECVVSCREMAREELH